MISARWHKVFNDLWGHKLRTGLIVLSIAVGLFAVGMIVSSRSILSTELDKSFAAINPSSGVVRTLELFDEDFVRSIRSMRDVEEVEARHVLSARIQADGGEKENISIFIVADYDDMRVNKIWPAGGAWPPPERAILIERAALPLLGAEIGDTVVVETPNGKERLLPIAGLAHDLAQLPAQMDGTAYGYVSFETLEWLGESYGFNELDIVTTNHHDRDHVQRVINEIKNKAERIGYTIPLSMTAEPGQLPLGDVLDAILLVMGVLGLLSLFLSAFLIVNTIFALLAQQKRQIGIMKAIGASTRQIMGMYLAMVTFYGVIALIFAIPAGIVGSQALSRYMATLFNFDLVELDVPYQAIVLQVVVGILIPVLASIYPFVVELRVTAAQAMRTDQMGKGRFGAGWIDRLMSGAALWVARGVPIRSWLLSLRNTFRSKGRLVLTLITLTLGGAIFISVFSVRDSLLTSLDDLLKAWNFDTMIIFSRSYRTEEIERRALEVPGVIQADTWVQMPVRRVRDDDSESGTIYLFAPHLDSPLIAPPVMVEGRWLLPEDDNAVVITAFMQKDEPDIQLGDEIMLNIGGRERVCRVVGVAMGSPISMAYANYEFVTRVTGNTGRADVALVDVAYEDRASIDAVTKELEAHYERVGLNVSGVGTLAREMEEAEAMFGILVYLMLVMAVLLAIVGGLGLMGTMSINVLERTREIGVLRAIGAPNRGVAQVFIGEGIAIGLISWLLGALFAFPLSQALSNAVGELMMGAPLTFSYSVGGLVIWLALILLLSALASFVPARNASRLTVREVLAYE